MLPLLSLHAIAAQRDDGLHPVLLDGLRRIEAARLERLSREADRRPEAHASHPIADQAAPAVSAKPSRAG
ncbi:MAG: hypothetical protein QOG17_102 [Gammaproteobacteria bacterium]|jgi:hypothetical protein|nr:hypothetical protein [Gammaproteobacteria bacterium]